VKKTSQADFDEFKHECLRLQKEWGLLEYSLYFTHGTPTDAYATCSADEEGCVARLCLTKTIAETDAPHVLMLAKHEMIHLLMSRVEWIGRCRWASDDELDVEVERLVVKLEKII